MRDKKQCDIEALERNNPRISVLRMRESSAAYRVDKVKSAVLIWRGGWEHIVNIIENLIFTLFF